MGMLVFWSFLGGFLAALIEDPEEFTQAVLARAQELEEEKCSKN